MKEKKAIIVGAGLVGSLLSVLLAKRGYEVHVYEGRSDMRKAGFIGGRSINLAMSDRGWRALRKAGIARQLEDVAIPMRGRMIHNRPGSLAFQAYGKEDQAIYSVSRGGLNLELIQIADQFEKVHFHFDMRCRGVDLKTNTAHFEQRGSGKRFQVEAPLIFGTDGAFSAVRGSMMRTDRFDYSQTYLEYGYKELTIPPNPDGSHAMELNALHIWPRGSFMLIALPNVDGTFTCTLFLPFEGEQSFEKLDSDAAIEAFFREQFPDAVPLLKNLLDDFHGNPTASLVTVRCSPWIHQNRVLLLGDAAHAIVPFYGQGMNAGFEDCSVLDDLMEEFVDDWDHITPAYNAARVENGHAIADLALRNFVEMRDQVADPKFLLRKKIAAFLHDRYSDFLPVYSMVTFSHIPYSEAWEETFRQDALFARILSIPDIEQKWNGPEVIRVFEEWRKGG